MAIYDITPPITPNLAVWPGDTPPSRQVLCDMKAGANITLSTLHATVHLGAHADGPNHYGADAPAIDRRPLDFYLGPCLVVRVDVPRGTRVTVGQFEAGLRKISDVSNIGAAGATGPSPRPFGLPTRSPSAWKGEGERLPPRVLIATGTYPDSTRFHEDFAALEPALIDALHDCGVRLIGIDTPSVDLFTSKELPAHGRFLANDMAILEGLVLRDVPPRMYELIALPLPLVGFDASPVRAVLREP